MANEDEGDYECECVYVAEIDLRRFRMPGIIRIIMICLEAYKINTLMVFKGWQFFDQNKCELERSGRMVTQANHMKKHSAADDSGDNR